MKSLSVAFIGGGASSAIGYTHFNASRMDGAFSLVAGCFSRDSSENIRSALAYGVSSERVYSDWKSLIEAESGRLDAVFVLTPIPSHVDIVISALDSGVPVICEKALSLSSDECIRVSEAICKNNGYLAVTLNYSGYPMVRQLREMVISGRLGDVKQIVIEMPQEGFLRTNVSPQGWRLLDYGVPTVSLDLGVHVHHLVSFISGGKRPLKVIGDESSHGVFYGLIDNVYAMAHYEDELRVQMWWGKAALGNRNGLRVRVFGSKASAEWYQMNPEILIFSESNGRCLLIDRSSIDADVAHSPRYNRFKAGHPSGFIEAFSNLYFDIYNELLGFKRGVGFSSGFVFGADHSLEGLRFIEAVHKSSIDRCWIDL